MYRHQSVGERKVPRWRGPRAFWTAVGVTALVGATGAALAAFGPFDADPGLTLALAVAGVILIAFASMAASVPALWASTGPEHFARVHIIEGDPQLRRDSLRVAGVALAAGVLLLALGLLSAQLS